VRHGSALPERSGPGGGGDLPWALTLGGVGELPGSFFFFLSFWMQNFFTNFFPNFFSFRFGCKILFYSKKEKICFAMFYLCRLIFFLNMQ